MRFVAIFFFSLALFSCGRKEEGFPSEIISPDTMSKILTELHLAQSAIAVNAVNDSSSYRMNDYQQFILEKYKIAKPKFLKSVEYYTSNPEVLTAVYDSVILELTRLQAETK